MAFNAVEALTMRVGGSVLPSRDSGYASAMGYSALAAAIRCDAADESDRARVLEVFGGVSSDNNILETFLEDLELYAKLPCCRSVRDALRGEMLEEFIVELPESLN